MSTHYAVRDRDGSIHQEPSRKDAVRSQRAYGGMVIQSKNGGTDWRPYKRRRVFLWFFLAVQVIFIIWLIAGGAESTAPSAAQVAHLCGNGQWQGLFTSYHDCVVHGANGLKQAGDIGKGLGLAAVVIIWVIVDFLLAVTYGIYRLARR